MELRDIQHIRYKRLFFNVADHFLCSLPELSDDINYCIQVKENSEGKLQEFYTLLIDLKQDLDRIKEGIYHRTLTEINSFLNNQEYEYKLHYPVGDSDLLFYVKLFNSFAESKRIRKAELFRLKAYNKEKILAISVLRQTGKPLCINFYRLTQQRATNLHTFSMQQDLSASQSGRAHRSLHWLDIVEFRNMGVAFYDFGGWYEGQSDKVLLNINRFKEEFTKLKVKEYTGVIYINPALVFLRNIIS